MRLGIGQVENAGDLPGTIAAAAALVQQAADAGADLLLLHELFTSGYDLDGIADDRGLALTHNDDRLELLRQACARTSTAVLIGAAVDDGTHMSNALLLVDTAGSSEVVYRKIHLWDDERDVFSRGDQLTVLTVAGARVGLAICYDAGFPEVARAYGRAGVDLIIYSSAFSHGDQEHRYDIYHPARALENGVFVAVANAIGDHGGSRMFGRSALFTPHGELVNELTESAGLMVHDIDPKDRAAKTVPYLQDLQYLSIPTERTI